DYYCQLWDSNTDILF
nr:immunoglobulin light chain junction region [Macaca mulatta]MOV96971.1 immunoglobulin light chain junction region [Macaca mulatta]MOV97618.1 immunoglobulin light chain junction region [Macaca mulatta]MOV98992.1 immunoglobulin light chain junction region [Macaca mulatta]MOV99848.1 immunoglobulin light chain junction region [Macaca mulatta]